MSKRGEFTIPSLDEIKAANKISGKNEPSLFKASSVQLRPAASADPTKAQQQAACNCAASQSSPPTAACDEKVSAKVQQCSSLAASEGLTSASKETTADKFASIRGTSEDKTAKSSDLPTAPSTSASASGSLYRPHAIVVNVVQKKNPLMKHVRNVPWEVGNIIPDFELGKTTCALFLSVRYHCLHPNYIHERLKALGKQYQLRVLLVLVDTGESQKVLRELAKMALLADLTLILSWSYEEAARYLETYKAYENKPPDMIMERIDSDSSSRVIECLTTVKKVNRTDAATLMNTFKTMEKLVTASKEELTLCPGLGPLKAQRLYDLFHEPFLKSTAKKPKLEQKND